MKDGYRQILNAKPDERRQVYAEATEAWTTSETFIEKDFFVCAALDVLFNDVPDAQKKLVFKGGTSLSKAHKVIRRFSEDIDLIIVREELGFSGDKDPMKQGELSDGTKLSGKGRDRLVDALKAEAAKYVASTLKPVLEGAFAPFGAKVSIDADDDQTLLISYPSAFDNHSEYNPPVVKIEGGARSATLPAHPAEIDPYIAAAVSDIDLKVPNVQTIDAERTFLDKVLILHGRHCHFRDLGKAYRDANRESRHYYDLAMMADHIGPGALRNHELLADVITHSALAGFRRGWMKFDEAERGDMFICPPKDMLKVLERDYDAMAGMILDEAPKFTWVMGKIEEIRSLYENEKHKAA